MRSIKEIIEQPSVSAYTGSQATKECVRKQIEERWGKKEADRYDPKENFALTFTKWSSLGYRIKPGQKALKSITFVEVKDEKGEVIKKLPRTVHLFYHLQVRNTRLA